MKSVVIIGVGALGSHLVQFIRNLPVILKVIDDDRLEQKNTLSQFHGVRSVGKSKVDSLRQAMDFFFKIKLDVVPHRLTENNIAELLSKADLVIDCLDNAPSRQIVQDYVRKHNIQCLHGALDANGTFGQAAWDEIFEIDSGSPVGTPTCENGDHLPFIVVTSSLLAKAAQDFLVRGIKHSYQIHPKGVFTV